MARPEADRPTLAGPDEAHGREILRRQGTTADVTVYERDGRLIGLKTVTGRGWIFRGMIGRRLIRREMEIYSRLRGVPGIPTLLGPADGMGFYFEYRPGTLFSRYTSESQMPALFLDGLERTVKEMHDRGIAHGDLHNRDNILVGPDFSATIFDFGTAARRDGRITSHLFRLLAELDRRALAKYRGRHSGGPIDRTWRVRPHPLERLSRGLKRLNILHRKAKERRKRSEIKEVLHLGEEAWRRKRGRRTKIRWAGRPESIARSGDTDG